MRLKTFKNNHSIHMKLKKHITTLAVITMSGFLLSGCGGSDSSSKTPGTGAITVINGITVPPSPDPVTNNATLAGVDSNNNGIRDDVDRLIAIINNGTVIQSNITTRISAAMKAQIALTATTQNPIDYRKYDCNISSLSPEDSVVFHNAIFNTKERRAMYKNNLPAAGTSYTLDVESAALGIIKDSTCTTSDVKAYKSNE